MQLRLSMVLLMNDSTIPWLILVPMRNGIMEIHELSADDRAVLIEELSMVSEAIQEIFKPDKINIGMLGNIVPQLHIHVIGRFSNDRAWPGPVWGTPLGSPYAIEQADHVSAKIKQLLQKGC
jgi:diadenosine tetraphosphate (Ap4A) HIT family hydrolase